MFLENTNDNIADIASKTGFVNAIDLTRAFKQSTGLTPSKYREQKQQEDGGKQSATMLQDSVEEAESNENTEKTDEYELIED